MSIFNMMRAYARDESGAVTVDWVVLTAAIVGLAIAVLGTLDTGLDTAASSINDAVTGAITQ